MYASHSQKIKQNIILDISDFAYKDTLSNKLIQNMKKSEAILFYIPLDLFMHCDTIDLGKYVPTLSTYKCTCQNNYAILSN